MTQSKNPAFPSMKVAETNQIEHLHHPSPETIFNHPEGWSPVSI